MSGERDGRGLGGEDRVPLTRDEYLDFLVEQAPEITEEQWQDTITILALYRGRSRVVRGGEPPGVGEYGGSAA